MSPAGVRVEILHVPECALLQRARELVATGLAATSVPGATVECVPGDYPSPTILVNGMDVSGRDLAPGAVCRLDLPSEEQLRAALAQAARHMEPTA